MATYIQGVTDYIPKIQPFRPDFNFYATALQTMQDKYDTNYKQLSEYWGAVLKSPMLRDDNIQRRDKFMNSIQDEIKKISGMDLSLKQNVDQAMKVLDPVVNDKYILNDIVKTKQWNNARSYGQSLQGTENGWDGGIKALDYWAQDFKKVSADDALSFNTPDYVENMNLYKMAMDDAAKNKFTVKIDNVSADGRWLVTDQNGRLLATNLRDYMIGRFGSDPRVMKFLNTKAYVERKDYITANLDRFGGNEAQAQMAYAQGKLDETIKTIKASKISADDKKKMIDAYTDAYADYVAKNGVLPIDKGIIAQGQTLQQAQQNATNTKNVADAQATTLDLYMKDYMDFLSNGSKLDQIMAMGDMYKVFGDAANSYAYMTEERVIKGENPYTLEAVKHANDIALEDHKLQNDIVKIEHQERLKDKLKRQREGLDMTSDLQQIENFPGASTPMITSGVKQNMDKNNQLFTEVSALKAGFLSNMGSKMLSSYDKAVSSGSTNDQAVIRGAIETIFKPLGIKTEDLLNPTKRGEILQGIAKLDQASSPNLWSSYRTALDQVDPDKNIYNNVWAKDITQDPNFYTQVDNINGQDRNLNIFLSKRMDQLNNVIIRHYLQPGNDRTKILASILTESTNGFFPADYRKDAIIKKLVARNEADAKKRGEVNFYTKEYYERNWNEAKKVWNESYANIPNIEAWNHIEGLGPNSNALAGQGTVGNFNYGNRSRGSTTELFETIMKDVDRAVGSLSNIEDNQGGLAIVGRGNNGTELTETDTKALEELRVLLNTRGVYNDPKDEKTFAGRFEYANISQGNDKYIGITIYPSQKFVESFQKDKSTPRILTGEPITIRIDKSLVPQNVLYKQAQTSADEYVYGLGHPININLPSGSATIVKTDYGPSVDYSLRIYNPERKDYDQQSFSQSYVPNTDVDDIKSKYQLALSQLNQMNAVNIANDRMVYGAKDIGEILKATLKGKQEGPAYTNE